MVVRFSSGLVEAVQVRFVFRTAHCSKASGRNRLRVCSSVLSISAVIGCKVFSVEFEIDEVMVDPKDTVFDEPDAEVVVAGILFFACSIVAQEPSAVCLDSLLHV